MPNTRLAASELKRIQRNHILQAIKDLDAHVTHAFADSTGFDLVYLGTHYPPKAVFGVAGRYALGKELLPEHFSGGEDSTCFQVLRREGFEIIPKQRAFLLTWNPERYTLDQFRNYLSRASNDEETWSTGPRKELPVGSRLYLMRLGIEPKGIVGIGRCTGAVQQLPHWDPSRQKRGDTSNYASVSFDKIQEEPFLPLQSLIDRWPQLVWTPQSSGIEILDNEVITYLDGILASKGMHLPEEVSEGDAHTEGAVTKITVNAYERDPAARKKCLQHYGYRCGVCAKTMDEIYGSLASGIIHVHHRTPLHTIGKAYVVDPIRDLLPVCPNCHAVLHRTKPAMTVEELKQVIGQA
jgi:5-methylcytosine-specific restriction protein A